MKRILSFILSFVLIVTSLSAGLDVVAQTVPHQSELEKFAANLTNMVRKYDNEKVETSSDSTLLDEITESFPIIYTEHYLSAYKNNADDNDLIEDNKTATDFGLPENAFDLNRLIVKSKNEIDYYGAVGCVNGYKDLHILQYNSLEDTISAYEYYLSLDTIEYVEPDYISSVQGEVEELPKLNGDASEFFYEIIDKVESWNSTEIGYEDIKEELAQRPLSDVVVAVLDSGADTDHEIFENRLIENDVNFSSTGDENSVEDDYGHGTHVAGIIADNTLNNVKIKPYKVLNNIGKGTLSLIAIAVDLAVADGADIINLSVTSKGESQTMTDSVNAATDQGVNVVVSAGNKSADLSKIYYSPACIESAITVSAVTKDFKLSSYSNYNGTIDIAAPGDDIKSSYLNNTYQVLDGTSMAAPQVAAGIAIIRSVYPELNIKQVEDKIKTYSIKMREDVGKNFFGAGVLYLKYILEEIPRTAEPEFNVDDMEFSNSFKVSLSCPEKDAKILYLLHNDEEIIDIGFLNGAEYHEPITVSYTTKISAVAISKGKLFSSIVTHEYIRSNKSEEDKYDIDNSGMITGYFGNDEDVIVPSMIKGIEVKGVADSAFRNNQQIHSVTLPDSASLIGSYAFSECLNLEMIKGNGIVEVMDNAFESSSVSIFPFEQIINIGNYAFSGCNNLNDVKLKNAVSIGKSAFENSKGLDILSCPSLVTVEKNAFQGSDVKSVDFPLAGNIGDGAFKNCSELHMASFGALEVIPQNLFKDCISLIFVNCPKLKTIKANSFENTGIKIFASETVNSVGNLAFTKCLNLKYVYLPNATNIEPYCFNGCSSLKNIYLPNLAELNSGTFSKCDNLKSLWLPSVKLVNNDAFLNSSIEYLQLDNVEKIRSLPASLKGLVLSGSCVSVNVNLYKFDFKIYGYENTYAYQLATDNSKEFVSVPAMICETPENVSIDEQYIYTYALGFHCTYQWYKNDTVSNENGTLIEGATNFWYEPKLEDDAVCYYCVIVSDDGVNHNEIVTETITNIPEYRNADYSEYNAVVEEAQHIDRTLYNDESLLALDTLLALDISGYSLAEQELISQHIEAIKNAISSLLYDYELGDVNDDGKISLLDARLALKVVSGTEELDKLQTLSADMNEDGKISLIDVRAILRIVSEMVETE